MQQVDQFGSRFDMIVTSQVDLPIQNGQTVTTIFVLFKHEIKKAESWSSRKIIELLNIYFLENARKGC